MVAPFAFKSRYCNHDPSGTSTPARPATHRTSSEQSNAFGSGFETGALAPHTYASPVCASADCRKVLSFELDVAPVLPVSADTRSSTAELRSPDPSDARSPSALVS